jgi:hypothetical protein
MLLLTALYTDVSELWLEERNPTHSLLLHSGKYQREQLPPFDGRRQKGHFYKTKCLSNWKAYDPCSARRTACKKVVLEFLQHERRAFTLCSCTQGPNNKIQSKLLSTCSYIHHLIYVHFLPTCRQWPSISPFCNYSQFGHAIAQAVSRWFSTAAARVRSRVWSSGICGGQSGAGAGFLRVLRFPLPIFIPPIAPVTLTYHLGLVQ